MRWILTSGPVLAALTVALVMLGSTSPEPASAASASAVAAGGSHTCALTTAGGLKCWGSNSVGELGDGTTTNRTTPVDVSGLTSGVAGVDAGDRHTCARTTAGGLKCWGSNNFGQLGDGTSGNQRTTPVDVSGLTSGVVAVSAGVYHTCAVTTAGLKCWGDNGDGQLGDGTTTQRTTPVDVCATGATPPCTAGNGNVLTGVAAVAAGASHTCALTTAGGVKCWGSNWWGQLGDGTATDRTTPVDVCATGATPPCTAGNGNVLTGVAAAAAGWDHTCAVTTAGGLKCWGNNWSGQLGDGTSQSASLTPVDVAGLTSGVAAVAAGADHTCALTTTAGLKCWGGNSAGQLGDGTTTDRTTPVDVAGLTGGVAAVAAGGAHTCAVMTTAGGLKCWGRNAFGQLGDGTTTTRTTWVWVVGMSGSVGGVLEPADLAALPLETGGSGRDYTPYIAGVAAAGAMLLVAGSGWYARRRWLR